MFYIYLVLAILMFFYLAYSYARDEEATKHNETEDDVIAVLLIFLLSLAFPITIAGFVGIGIIRMFRKAEE